MTLLSRIALACLLFAAALAAADKPNFIIIFVDDLGYADIGPFGSILHKTPALDRMAAEGRKFTDFYVSANVCTPSRASLMTGSYPRRVSLHESEKGAWVLFPGNQRGINAQENTMGEALRDAGYRTAIIGKWHLGDQPEYLPTRHGFQSYFGIPYSNDMGHDSRPQPYRYPPLPLLRDESVIESEPDQHYITQRYTQEALKFLESAKDEPFFLYLPHTMPHWPQYSSESFAGRSQNGAWGDAVEEVDWSTEQIFAKLEELKIDEKTLVIFTSDNGGARQHGAQNGPLRGGKGGTWEGGHRVCMVARWPGKIPAGTATDEMALSMDLLPTFSALAGAKLDPKRTIDGKDIRPLLLGETGAKSPHEAYYYYFMGHLDAVRSGPWKLFTQRTSQGGREHEAVEELYDLRADIGETKNVAAAHPDVVRRLKGLMEKARADLGDGDRKGSGARPAGFVADAVTLTPQ